MSRAKGTRFEREAAEIVLKRDGPDPIFEQLASSTGRVGHLDLGADVYSATLACEMKNREDLSMRLWTWLDHIKPMGKMPCLLLRRNRKRPLIVMGLHDFFDYIDRVKEQEHDGE